MLDDWNLQNILIVLLIAWAGYHAIIFLSMAVRLLRVPVWPVRMQAADERSVPGLTPDQSALLDELRQLGFEPLWHGSQIAGPNAWPAAVLRHADGVSHASVAFNPNALTGYTVVICSIDADGQVLSTTNRLGWFTRGCAPEPRQADAYADSLAQHLAAHRARVAHLAPADADRAVALILKGLDESHARLRAAGSLRIARSPAQPDHLTLAAALRCAFGFMRVRRKLTRPYACAATAPAHRRAFFIACFAEMERQEADRAARPNLKTGLLVVSMAAALLLWTWAFDWRQAVALVLILLIHECGHAIAMRAFGWKDLTMFFIPFIGAIVTGRPRPTTTGQQAVVLLAGPLPGLLAGIAMLYLLPASQGFWMTVASMAVFVNLFNLLPVTPLDGGRLVEAALFSRWPRVRVAFFVGSVAAFLALALWLESKPALIITLFLAISLPGQLRMARLQAAWQDEVEPAAQVGHLYDAATRSGRAPALAALMMLIRNAIQLQHVRRPRLTESIASIAVLALVWAGSGYALTQTVLADRPGAAAETRSPAQLAFDRVWDGAEFDQPADAVRQRLHDAARALGADDPRHIDLQVWQAQQHDGGMPREAVERLLQGGLDGRVWKRSDVLREHLDGISYPALGLPPVDRATRLREAIAWAEGIAPALLAPTIETHLRLAEAIDDGGDSGRAGTMLGELRERAASADDCRCELSRVIRAQAWFHLHHGNADRAIAVLEGAQTAGEMRSPGGRLALDYGWALLAAGRHDEAVEQMRIATRTRRTDGAKPARLRQALDLAHALRKAQRDDEARRLVEQQRPWECAYARSSEAPAFASAPWEQARDRARNETARALCPPLAMSATGR